MNMHTKRGRKQTWHQTKSNVKSFCFKNPLKNCDEEIHVAPLVGIVGKCPHIYFSLT